VTLTVNGEPVELAAGETVAQLVERLRVAEAGVAVAVDGAVVPRHAWPEFPLHNGAVVEVLSAVPGG
jgi:sulfur carrier protein